MKKAILFIIFIFSFFLVSAQKFYVGAKVGLNMATLTGTNDTLLKKSLQGYHASVLANIGISDVLSLQPELTYSKKGTFFNYSKPQIYGITGLKIILNYINLTLLAKAMFGGETIRGFVNVGPYAGYMINGKILTLVDSKSFANFNFNFNASKEIKRLDLGATAGIGITFRAGPGDVLADFRYSLGLLTVNDDPTRRYYKGKYTNSVVDVSIGYVIPLGDLY